jgi:sugar-specific transcriptional regulator TrmB
MSTLQTLEEVRRSRVLKKAMAIVKRARKEILVTMDLAEEERTPLPQEYFILLKSKIKKGVMVRRLAFGSKKAFMKFKEKHGQEFKESNYECRLITSGGYQRMLLADRKELLYAKERKGERKYWYSRNPIQIKKFLDYFKKKWGNDKRL